MTRSLGRAGSSRASHFGIAVDRGFRAHVQQLAARALAGCMVTSYVGVFSPCRHRPMSDLRDQVQASLGPAYTITGELVGGGMSRVFLAEDRSLGRKVVVKVLPPEMAGQVSVDRFRREIALVARLQHPHIVPLLTAGEVDGLPYFTMPWIAGESLRVRLAKHGELPVNEAVRILREVASALAFAHAAGVVHRDIKPDNVLLSGGAAMVTDFGVAKALSASTGADVPITALGVALGTPAYMSPEQASADPLVDHRADVYAWGVLAYELLTGSTPFGGRPAVAMLSAHVIEPAEQITNRRKAIPAPLAALVMRCLEKRPADRPQSADELVHALDTITTPSNGMPRPSAQPAVTSGPDVRRRWSGVAVLAGAIVVIAFAGYWRLHALAPNASAVRTIAVLPFENKSGDSTYDYFAEGLSDELRSALNRMPGLNVKARSSSVRFGGGHEVRDVGAKLGVGAVLEGTVSRSASRLHVTAELVNAGDENTLWSATFDLPVADLGTVQDSIASAIASALRVSLAPPPPRGMDAGARAPRGTSDFAAYDLYLRGQYYLDRNQYERSVGFYRNAVDRDPGFARAYAGLATAYAKLPSTGRGSADAALAVAKLAKESADRALALDSTASDAWLAQGMVAGNAMQFADQEHAIAKALMIEPGRADLHVEHAYAVGQQGRLGEALAEVQQAHRLDPLNVTVLGSIQYTLYLQRRYREAIDATKAILDLDPKSVYAYQALGSAYAFAGHPDSAVAAFETAIKVDPNVFGGRVFTMFGYAALGRWADAKREGDAAERAGGNSPEFINTLVDVTFGKVGAAMTALERGVEHREPLFLFVSVVCDPLFDPLKSDPRFEALMRRLGARSCPASGKWPIQPRAR